MKSPASLLSVVAASTMVLLLIVTVHSQTAHRDVGPKKIVVHSKFNGTIFGFDIDQNGTEGVLTEGQTLGNGNILNAVEIFDQKTGKVTKVVRKTETADEDVTLGVVGTSVGLIEHDHVSGIFIDKRTYHVMNPLSSNKYTGTWNFDSNPAHIIMGVSHNQGDSTNAFFVYDNVVNNPQNFVFTSNVASNTFGRRVKVTQPQFTFGVPPVLSFDTKTNQAVIAQDFGSPTDVPLVGIIDTVKGKVTTFIGTGLGFVNGIAVDSDDGIAVTTTEIDFSAEFYNIKKHTGFRVVLAESNNQLNSGADVEYDPIHKLFLIAQPINDINGGSSIHVYDTKGNLVESLNGFTMPTQTVIPLHIALHPSDRTGYVDDVAGIRAFTY
jgi:hypothetical protein